MLPDSRGEPRRDLSRARLESELTSYSLLSIAFSVYTVLRRLSKGWHVPRLVRAVAGHAASQRPDTTPVAPPEHRRGPRPAPVAWQ